MLLKLIGLPILVFLVVLLPQAQSSRLRFVTLHRQHSHTHGQHHHAAASSKSGPLRSSHLHELRKPQIQMVTGANVKHPQIQMVTGAMVTVQPHYQVPDRLMGGNLDKPVSGSIQPGGMSESAASSSRQTSLRDMATVTMPRHHTVGEQLGGMLDTPVSGPNPGGNSESLTVSNGQKVLGEMLDTPVSGPNPGGNSESLLVSGPNLGGSSNTIPSMPNTPVSGPSRAGNFGNMLDTPVSGPNPGGNSQGLFVSGPNLRGSISGKGLASRLGNGNSEVLADSSGPNPGGNSEVLTASSGPNPGGNSVSLMSGPSPIHNSVVREQGLLAARSMKESFIGCEQEGFASLRSI